MRHLLGSWLEKPEWEPRTLVDWLQGYGLPCTGDDEYAHVWLLRGLPLTNDRLVAKKNLALRIAVLLREQPDVYRPGRHPDQVLYNLLFLAAGLECPQELADPLYEMYQRPTLQGEYLGVDLRTALRTALVENQIDDRLEGEWFALLEERQTAKLPGGPYQGFAGVLMMPASPETIDRPNLDAIGRALKQMAHFLEERSDRRAEFSKLLDAVAETYGDSGLRSELILQSDRYGWPQWASYCLPVFTIHGEHDSNVFTFIWSKLAREIPHPYQKTRNLCRDVFVEAVMPEPTARIVQKLASKIEPRLRANPVASASAVENVLQHVISEISEINQYEEFGQQAHRAVR